MSKGALVPRYAHGEVRNALAPREKLVAQLGSCDLYEIDDWITVAWGLGYHHFNCEQGASGWPRLLKTCPPADRDAIAAYIAMKTGL